VQSKTIEDARQNNFFESKGQLWGSAEASDQTLERSRISKENYAVLVFFRETRLVSLQQSGS
jgi:hypothetical protein